MKQRTVNKIRRMAAITLAKCNTCNTGEPNRCCDKVFCSFVAQGLSRAGIDIQRTDHPDLPFMGPNGCVVPPEYRPGCAGYVCPHHLRNREFRREHDRLHREISADPDVERLMPTREEVERQTKDLIGRAFRP